MVEVAAAFPPSMAEREPQDQEWAAVDRTIHPLSRGTTPVMAQQESVPETAAPLADLPLPVERWDDLVFQEQMAVGCSTPQPLAQQRVWAIQ